VVGTAFYHTQLESGCTFCGSCVEVCPTGALTEKMRKWDGKPASETTSTCPLCSLGCQVRLLAKQERVIGALAGCKEQNELCVKGRFGLPELVNPPSRLKRPQRRLGDTLQQASWEEAIRQAAEKLAACPPERFEMQVSACCTTEDLYVAHQFAREVMKGGAIHFTGTAGGGEGLEDFSRLLQQSRSLEAIDGAQAIFCLGLDDPYAQTVIEARLHRARQRGARLILCSDPGHPWRKYADHWLSTEDGEALRRLETLVARPGAEQPGGADGPAQIARLLQSSSSPLFILGPGILYRPQNRLLLRWLERLLGSLGAPAIVFSDPVNLRGALRLGLRPAKPSSERNDLDVLYLIGEAVPAHLSAKPFILYQNLYLPAGENPPHLLLPTTAFSEEQGTYIDYAGRVAFIHPAVAAPGEALPSWMILSRIAQYLGVQGFEYASVEDIWRAARAEIPEFPAFPPSAAQVPPLQAGEAVSWKELDLSLLDPPGGSSYMGYPLTQWVEGLRSLYPEKTREGIHEPHS